MKIIKLTVGIFVVLILLAACSRSHPAKPIVVGNDQTTMSVDKPAVDPGDITPNEVVPAGPDDHRVPPPPPEFVEAYKAAGKPRICFFFKRTLTDEISDWWADSKIDWDFSDAYSKRTSASGPEGDTSKTKDSNYDANVSRRQSDNIAQRYKQLFWDQVNEDHFAENFAQIPCRIVDLRIAMRKMAAHRQDEARKGDYEEKTTIEILALEDTADILIEVHEGKTDEGKTVYVAKAIGVKDNIVYGSASTYNMIPVQDERVSPPGSGVVIENKVEQRDLLEYMAQELMQRMARSL